MPRTITIDNAERWDELLVRCGGHLLQSYAWGELKERFGWRALRLALEQDGRLIAGAQILTRSWPLFTLAYVPRGPAAPPGPDCGSTYRAVLGAALDRARHDGAFLLKVEPDLVDSPETDELLASVGFAQTPDVVQPRSTIHIDLTPSLDAILAAMKPKWRYNIRLSAKKGVAVRAGTPDDLARIYELVQVTGTRDRFAVHSLEYYRAAAELLGVRDQARWLVAEHEGRMLAAIFVSAFGHEAIYLYGASGNEDRERMPNHALHWAAIQWAKARGCARYDLWGVPDEEQTAGAELPEGLYRFKQGFGGQFVRYTGAWERVLSPLRFQVYRRALARRQGL